MITSLTVKAAAAYSVTWYIPTEAMIFIYTLEEVEVMPDHIHLLVSFKPK